MSISTAAGALPEIEIPGRRFAKVFMDLDVPGGSFDQLPQAAQRFLLYMWEASSFGEEEVRKTAAEIARACGRGIRWVYKALRQCLDHTEGDDGAEAPLITKRFAKGPRDVAGRILALNVKFAEPKGKEDEADAKARPKSKRAPTYGTANPPLKPAAPTPAPADGPAHEPTPEEQAAIDREWEAAGLTPPSETARRAKEKAAEAERAEAERAKAPGGPRDAREAIRGKKHTPEELKAQLDVVRRMRAGGAPDPKPRE